MKKLLLALQYCRGDVAPMRRLARLIAAIEPKYRHDVDFMFAPRFDTPSDNVAMEAVAAKFDVYEHRGTRNSAGWPGGCNDLWFDLMSTLADGTGDNYEAVLTFEPDCCPLTADWIDKLSEKWGSISYKNLVCAGHIHPCAGSTGPDSNHLNGNAIFSCKKTFLAWLKNIGSVDNAFGWDAALAGQLFRIGWADIPEIRSSWRRLNVTEEEYRDIVTKGCVFFHGVKDASLIGRAERDLTHRGV